MLPLTRISPSSIFFMARVSPFWSLTGVSGEKHRRRKRLPPRRLILNLGLRILNLGLRRRRLPPRLRRRLPVLPPRRLILNLGLRILNLRILRGALRGTLRGLGALRGALRILRGALRILRGALRGALRGRGALRDILLARVAPDFLRLIIKAPAPEEETKQQHARIPTYIIVLSPPT
jgi:hypothetical protein